MALTLEVLWNGVDWTDESAYLRDFDVQIGMSRDDPVYLSFVAAPGTAWFSLDNKTRRFSPGHAGGALYGDLEPGKLVRFKSGSNALFTGFLAQVQPLAGQYRKQLCILRCYDWIEPLARVQASVAFAESKDVAVAIEELVDLAYTPVAEDYGDNGDTLVEFGKRWDRERTSVRQALRDVCASYFGRVFAARDGTIVYKTRGDFQDITPTAALEMDDEWLVDLYVGIGFSTVVNSLYLTVYPPDRVGSTAVLWSNKAVSVVRHGQARTFSCPFRDPVAKERCSADAVTTPVANTDYVMNSKRDGSGVDLTSSGDITHDYTEESRRLVWQITNTSGYHAYLTTMQVRGDPVYTYDPIIVQETDAASVAAYGQRVQALDLAQLGDDEFAAQYAGFVVGRRGAPALFGRSLRCRARATLAGVDSDSLELYDLIEISETQAGLVNVLHRIWALRYTQLETYIFLEPVSDHTYWILGDSTYGILEQTTRLAF